MSKLGGIPLNVPSDRIGEALAVGALDAITFSWESMSTAPGGGGKRMVDQLKYLLDIQYAAPELAVVMKQSVFDALPADLQALINQHTGRALSLEMAAQRDAADAAIKARFIADPHFVVTHLSAAESTTASQALAPALTEWAAMVQKRGVNGEALLAKARALAANGGGSESE